MVKSDPFVDDWSEEDYQFLISCLKNTVRTGGFVCGAFYRAMGCVEAEVYNRQHVEKEPYDCQLECKL